MDSVELQDDNIVQHVSHSVLKICPVGNELKWKERLLKESAYIYIYKNLKDETVDRKQNW